MINVPIEIDDQVGFLKLQAMGIEIITLSMEKFNLFWKKRNLNYPKEIFVLLRKGNIFPIRTFKKILPT